MIKNNRPYSIENGYIDDGLIINAAAPILKRVQWKKGTATIRSEQALYGLDQYSKKITKVYFDVKAV